jgi:hypothetical protein
VKDDKGNPVGVIHVQMAIMPSYNTGPGNIEGLPDLGEKFTYLFGKASEVIGDTHNVKRSVSR